LNSNLNLKVKKELEKMKKIQKKIGKKESGWKSKTWLKWTRIFEVEDDCELKGIEWWDDLIWIKFELKFELKFEKELEKMKKK